MASETFLFEEKKKFPNLQKKSNIGRHFYGTKCQKMPSEREFFWKGSVGPLLFEVLLASRELALF